MNILAGTEKYTSVIYNQVFGGKCNTRQGLPVVTPAIKKAVREIVPKKSQRLSRLSSSFSAIWVIPLSLWLFSAACSTKVAPCNGDTTADPKNDCLPLPPGNIDMEDLGSANGGIRVSWEAIEGAEKYETTESCQAGRVKLSDVKWGQGSGGSVTVNSYMLGVKSPGQVCYMRVRTCNQFGCGRWIERELIIGLNPPNNIAPRAVVVGAPPSVDASGNPIITNNPFQIHWDGVSDTTHYIIQEREGVSGWQLLGNIPSADAFTGDLTRDYGKNYSFRVKSCGRDGGVDVCGPWSSASELLLRLPPPASFGTNSATPPYSGNYSLSWSAGASSSGTSSASSVDRYEIEESTAVGSTWGPSSRTSSPASYAKNVGTYSYRIRSCLAGSVVPDVTCSAWSAVVEVTVPSLPVVTNVVAKDDPQGSGTNVVSGDASYTISWGAVTDASQYEITESIDGVAQTPSTLVASATPPRQESYTGKAYGKTYSYTVKACAGNNCGAVSDPVSVEVKLSTPSINSPITATFSGDYTVEWQGVSHADSYDWQEVSVNSPSDSDWEVATPREIRGDNRFQLRDQSPGLTFSYRVRACKDVSSSQTARACGDYSASESVGIVPLPVVTNVVAKDDPGSGAGGATTIVSEDASYTISWSAVTGAIEYEITESIDNVAQTPVKVSQIRKSYTGKAYGKIYSYTVKACAGSNCGLASSSVSVEVKLPAPINLQASVPSSDDGNYTISWDVVAGAAGGYLLEESQDGGTTWNNPTWNHVMLTTDMSVSHVFSNQAGEKGYAYRVRACAVVSGCSASDPESSDWTTSANNQNNLPVRVNYLAPTGVKITDTGASAPITADIDGSYDVRWNAMPHAHSYKIRATARGQKKDGTPYPDVIISYNTSSSTTPSSPLYSFSSRPGHRDYSYEVSACNAEGGCGVASTQIWVTVTLPFVTMLASDESPSYDGTYSVSWDSVLAGYDSTHSYHLEERVPVPGGAVTTWRDIDATGAPERNDRVHFGVNLGATAPKGNYNYRVRACSDVGCVPRPPAANYLVVNFQSLGAPTLAVASGQSGQFTAYIGVGLVDGSGNPHDGSYTLAWGSVTGAVAYKLTEDGVVIPLPPGATTSRIPAKAAASVHEYQLAACADAACSMATFLSSSSSLSVTTRDLTPPVLTSDESPSLDGSYAISWTSVTGAMRYVLREKKGSGSGAGVYTEVYNGTGTGTGTRWQVPSAKTESVSYFYSLRVYGPSNIYAESAVESEVVVTLNCPSVTTVSWTVGTNTCSARTTAAVPHGQSVTLTDADGSHQGSVTATCNSGMLSVSSSSTDTCGVPGASQGFPIIITSYTELKDVKNGLDKHYRLGNDINASPSRSEGASNCVAYTGSNGDDATCTGFTPIGASSSRNNFTGSLEGAGYKITNLYIKRPSTSYVGLFGYVSNAEIKNIGVTDVYIVGRHYVGGLIGSCSNSSFSSVSNSYAMGTVTGNFNVGGLIGRSHGSVSNSYATGAVTGTGGEVGGLIGNSQGTVSNSYATGAVTGWGNGDVGGLIGQLDYSSFVSNSYAMGAVTGTGGEVGGLIGNSEGFVSNSYAMGAVTGTGSGNSAGGLVGYSEGSVSNSYATGAVTGGTNGNVGGLIGEFSGSVSGKNYFVDASGTNGIGGGTACSSTVCVSQTAAQIAGLASSSGWTVSTSGSPANWNFGTATQFPAVLYSGTSCETISGTNDITSNEGDVNIPDCGDLLPGQPIALGDAPSVPIIISTYAHLKTVKNGLDKHYRLGNDIDASASWSENDSSATCVAYNGSNEATANCRGFTPIGGSRGYFTGSFDGAGYKITKLYIKRPSTSYVGLFGLTHTSAEIKNIGVTDAYIAADSSYVGGLIGHSGGSVSNSYATGAVTGTGGEVGGLIGKVGGGQVSNSYATGDVTVRGSGRYIYVGGLIGYARGSVRNSYATGAVTGGADNRVGGLIGGFSGSVSNSYATGAVTGTGNRVGGLVGSSGSGSVGGKNYFVDASGGTNGLGSGTCSGTCTRKTAVEIAALSSSSGWTVSTSGTTGNWNFGTTTQFPAVLYSGTSCETISGTNNITSNEGDVNIPDCGDMLPGQPIALGDAPSVPIVISTYAQLKTIKNGLDKHYRLGNDIDASPSWSEGTSGCVAYNGSNGKAANGNPAATCTGFTPIGNNATRFSGSFDGAGHKITKLYIKRGTLYVGLFAYTSNYAEIKNIGMTDAYVVGQSIVGGLIGGGGGSVSNSYATGAVTGTGNTVGGLIGWSRGGSVSNSYATGAVTSGSSNEGVGGLIGSADGGSVSNSYATGAVTGSSSSSVGGLIGWSRGGSVSNSYATGAVTGRNYVGGLIGSGNFGGSVSNSYATGTVTGGANGYVGGLIGNLRGSVSNSYATGAVTGGANGDVGGLIGNWYSGSVTGKNYFADSSGTNGIGVGKSCSSTVCVSQTAAQIAALTTASGWTTGSMGNWNYGTTTQFPAVLYSGAGCETIATNDINSNEGDASIPDCGDIIKGQR